MSIEGKLNWYWEDSQGNERDLVATYTAYPEEPCIMYGDDAHPGEPASVEVSEIKDLLTGDEIELSSKQQDALVEAIFEYLNQEPDQ